MNAESASTPLMRQYHAIKQQVPGALLMFRLGDFYELFYEDAAVAAKDSKLRSLRATKKRAPYSDVRCAVPRGRRLHRPPIGRGYRVAICDQMEEAGHGKKLVRRDVTRIVTPGRRPNAHLLRSHESNYLAAVSRPSKSFIRSS